jgi:transcriptional regulator with PAS, ATPase and Fis domain
LLRYLAGEPMRAAARILTRGRVIVTTPSGPSCHAEIADLSDSGVCLTSHDELPRSPVTLCMCLAGVGELTLRAEHVRTVTSDRSAPSVAAYRFVCDDASGQAILRRHLVGAAHRRRELQPADAALAATGAGELLGRSPAIVEAMALLDRVAGTDVTVLLTGETGTGKALAARLLHRRSRRRAQPFVAVNCAALPENLVESELFGHEAGAFTGATRRKPGLIEQAQGGTLFLDEIAELPLAAQAKLLHALEDRAIRRLGGCELIPIDFRLIAATNQDLLEHVDKRAFRRDLFFRLNVVAATLPPLREHLEDLPELVHHFVQLAQQRMGRRGIRLGATAIAAMMRHSWPGNVRELENVCNRVVALAADDALIAPDDLHLVDARRDDRAPAMGDLHELMRLCERTIVNRVLERHNGNRTRTAHELGISRQALQQKLARFRDLPSGATERGGSRAAE